MFPGMYELMLVVFRGVVCPWVGRRVLHINQWCGAALAVVFIVFGSALLVLGTEVHEEDVGEVLF